MLNIFVFICRLLVYVTHYLLQPDYFTGGLQGALVDQEVLKELIAQKLPRLTAHLADYEVNITNITLPWIMSLFYSVVPFEVCFLF